MSTTNVSSIKTALETMIAALDPAGSDIITPHATYRKANPKREWSERSKSDIDREFIVEDIEPGNPVTIGIVTECEIHSSIIVKIAHWKISDLVAAKTRRDTDLFQIARAMDDKGKFPTNVRLIRFRGQTITDTPDYWETTMRFFLSYTGDPTPGF